VAEASVNKLDATLHEFLTVIPTDRPFALVGGLAVSARTVPRFTQDIDFVIAVENDAEAEEVVFSLQRVGYLVSATIEQKVTGRLGTARLQRGPKEPIVDLLFSACGIEREVAATANVLFVRDVNVPVASTGHLIAMKLISRNDKLRPDDRADLTRLAQVATDDDWQLAREAIALIEQRGFARKRDLPAALAEWQALAAELE
jgi:hypothetical protein